jgi:putative flippase GtrA
VTRTISVTGPRFLAVGVLNTLAGLAVIFAAKAFVGAGDVVANIAGYGVGLGISFFLNRMWTFGHRGNAWTALARFLLVFACAYLVNLSTVLLLIRGANVNGYLAQTIGIVPYTLFGFLANRYFVFGSTRSEQTL